NFVQVHKHPKHCYTDGSLILQAEGTLYRIHRHISEISPAFAGVLGAERQVYLGVHDGDKTRSDQKHSELVALATCLDETVKSVELEALLDLLYTPFYAAKSLTLETYRLALPLSIKWGFEELRKTIFSELENRLDLLNRYSLARELHIPE
ncbi:hypothetical protein FRC08_010647, partial [Ceratobasidium sp. 394]